MIVGYSLRQQAQADLESIWIYSYQQWGTEQADQYIRSLLSRFTWLSENPQLGKQRTEIKPGYFCFPEGMPLTLTPIDPPLLTKINPPRYSP